jgi:hypothetical protein
MISATTSGSPTSFSRHATGPGREDCPGPIATLRWVGLPPGYPCGAGMMRLTSPTGWPTVNTFLPSA